MEVELAGIRTCIKLVGFVTELFVEADGMGEYALHGPEILETQVQIHLPGEEKAGEFAHEFIDHIINWTQ